MKQIEHNLFHHTSMLQTTPHDYTGMFTAPGHGLGLHRDAWLSHWECMHGELRCNSAKTMLETAATHQSFEKQVSYSRSSQSKQ